MDRFFAVQRMGGGGEGGSCTPKLLRVTVTRVRPTAQHRLANLLELNKICRSTSTITLPEPPVCSLGAEKA